MYRVLAAVVMGCALLLAGCGAKRATAYTMEAAAEAGGELEAREVAAQAAWDAREDGDQLRESLRMYEELAAEHPDRRDYMERLSRGYYLLGTGHLEDEEAVLDALDKGASWGERILGLSEAFRTRVEAGEKDFQVLDVTTTEDVPGIYWSYANLGRWSVAKGFATVLKNKSKLKAFIDRVHALDPDYYHGAADRGLGAYYAKAPSFAGGDLDLAKEHFEASLAIAPDYFSTKVLMAEFYATKTQDRELFERLLNEVIAGDPTVMPDVVPIQKIEQANARELLDQVEDLFQ